MPESARYTVGQRFQGNVERIVPGGSGLVRGPCGVVFVAHAAPGDLALIEIETVRSGAARGIIAELLTAGPGRAEAPCSWYGTCGGCDFQHLTYAAQIEAKRQIVEDALRRIGEIEPPGEIVVHPAPSPFGSRARVEFHADQERNAIGFFERQSGNVVPIDRCIASRNEINSALQVIRDQPNSIPNSIHLLAGNGQVRSDPAHPPIKGGPFWLQVGDFTYLADPGSFFQSSLELLPALVEHVSRSPIDGGGLAVDLYCGVGLFSLPLAKRFKQVIGVDADARVIGNAARSAGENHVANTVFVDADVRTWALGRTHKSLRPDLVVLDPPRSGLDGRLAEFLARWEAPRLTYVSCDPTTLARDLRILQRGRLRLVDVAIFDLFPQTHHVETVARLVAD